ncbi:hypothetical protein ASAP_2873 [Asaia bogorensis]|uniref:Uncharacterized protein n=1 Tax=Asaia bogorensis TaxID=91915 RepID=A0A060QJN8_9PROT|nr:hypothetical protein ASAP_2873 [Asaia bogorensis]
MGLLSCTATGGASALKIYVKKPEVSRAVAARTHYNCPYDDPVP